MPLNDFNLLSKGVGLLDPAGKIGLSLGPTITDVFKGDVSRGFGFGRGRSDRSIFLSALEIPAPLSSFGLDFQPISADTFSSFGPVKVQQSANIEKIKEKVIQELNVFGLTSLSDELQRLALSPEFNIRQATSPDDSARRDQAVLNLAGEFKAGTDRIAVFLDQNPFLPRNFFANTPESQAIIFNSLKPPDSSIITVKDANILFESLKPRTSKPSAGLQKLIGERAQFFKDNPNLPANFFANTPEFQNIIFGALGTKVELQPISPTPKLLPGQAPSSANVNVTVNVPAAQQALPQVSQIPVSVPQKKQLPLWWVEFLLDLGISVGGSVIPPLFFSKDSDFPLLPQSDISFLETPLLPIIDDTDLLPFLLLQDEQKNKIGIEKIPQGDNLFSSLLTKQNTLPLLLIALLIGYAVMRKRK